MKFNTKLLVAAAMLSTLSLVGCVTTPQEVGVVAIKNETQASINKRIIAGKSTKADVLRELGEPSAKDFDDNDSSIERWTYTYLSHQVQADGTGYLPFATLIKHDNSTTSRTVTVIFKHNGIVRNVNVSSSDFKSTVGVL